MLEGTVVYRTCRSLNAVACLQSLKERLIWNPAPSSVKNVKEICTFSGFKNKQTLNIEHIQYTFTSMNADPVNKRNKIIFFVITVSTLLVSKRTDHPFVLISKEGEASSRLRPLAM